MTGAYPQACLAILIHFHVQTAADNAERCAIMVFFTHHKHCTQVCSSTKNKQQSCQPITFLLAFHSANSSSFNSLFKVLFIFPSRYLFATGLKLMFIFTWNLPPTLHSIPKKRDSENAHCAREAHDGKREYHPCCCSVPRGVHPGPHWQCISTLHVKAESPDY